MMEVTMQAKSGGIAEGRRPDGPVEASASCDKKHQSEYHLLCKRTSHFLGGNICLFLIGLISFPILARIFSVEQYGLIALVSSTIAVAVVFGKCGLQSYVQRFFKEAAVSPAPGSLDRYYSTVYLTAGSLGLLWSLPFALLVFRYVPRRLISDELQLLLGFAATLVFLRSISSMVTNLLQVQGRTTAYNVLQIGTKAATVALTVLLLLTWRRSPGVFFLGTVTVEAIAVLAVVPYLRRNRMFAVAAFDWRICRQALLFGIPMMGTEIFWLILDSGDRFLVKGFLGTRQLGFYAAAYNISGYIRESLCAPLVLALFPLVMELWVEKGRDQTRTFLSNSMNQFVLVSIAVVVAVSACASDAINIVASPKYYEAHRLLPVLITGMMLNALAMFPRSALMIHKKTVLMMNVNIVACLVNVALNVVLLPRIGLFGAAIATLGSYAVMTALFAFYAQRCLPLSADWRAWLKYSAVGVLTWFVVSRLEINHMFLSLVVRAGLSLILYFGILLVVDARTRGLTKLAVRTLGLGFGLRRMSGEGSAI
jgi:O-antigen/teichoic acid export membrane protein